MQTTTAAVTISAPALTARLIFRRTQAAIDRTWATALPVDVRFEACWDHILQAGRDLDRMLAHEAAAARLTPTYIPRAR